VDGFVNRWVPPYVRTGFRTVTRGVYRLKLGVLPMALGLMGTVGLLVRDDVTGVRRIVVERLLLDLAEATRLGLRPLVPMREGRLGLVAAGEVLRLVEAVVPGLV